MNGTARSNLAAVNSSDGTLLAGHPRLGTDTARSWSMVIAPDQSRVIVGGRFTTAATASAAYGMGSVRRVRWRGPALGGEQDDPRCRSTERRHHHSPDRWQAGLRRRLRLRIRRNFEGTFAADPFTGAITTGQRLPRRHVRHLPDRTGAVQRRPRPRLPADRCLPRHQPKGALRSAHWPRPSPRRPRTPARTTTAGTTTACPLRRCCTGSPTCRRGSYTGQYQAAWTITGNGNLRRHRRRVPRGQRSRSARPGPDGGRGDGPEQARSDL